MKEKKQISEFHSKRVTAQIMQWKKQLPLVTDTKAIKIKQKIKEAEELLK